MKWGQLLLCGWPGLAQLWCRGSYSSLLWAIGFSLVLNLALVATLLWPAILGSFFPAIAWPIIFLVWLISTWTSLKTVEQIAVPRQSLSDQERSEFSAENSGSISQQDSSDHSEASSHTLFNRAQREYLRGHWNEAEALLKQRLNQDERDIEARLLLATLYRHADRFDKASIQLNELERFDESVHWNFEIQRERQFVSRGREDSKSGTNFR